MESLTARQQEIHDLLVHGYTFAQIADELHLTKKTVSNCFEKICERKERSGPNRLAQLILLHYNGGDFPYRPEARFGTIRLQHEHVASRPLEEPMKLGSIIQYAGQPWEVLAVDVDHNDEICVTLIEPNFRGDISKGEIAASVICRDISRLQVA